MSAVPPKDSILRAIRERETQLAALAVECQRIEEELASLRAQQQQLERAPRPILFVLPDPPATAAEKVRLFRSLFRGREDVFPRLWVNAKSGKKGYAPACANEWVRGVCEKPKVKCGECPNQAFTSVSDQVILDHLRGKHVVGVYPLLPNDSCWFLAADFDKASWTDDVGAFVETCRAAGLSPAVERSRSGNGAHVWFFFTEPVPAVLARKMGCYLITEAMSRRHQLAMESYDRLFPNQDTLPRGGFGNLIALPLQQAPRQQGNTVMLDDRFESHSDQWAYLASIRRIDPLQLDSLVREASRTGRILGLRTSDDTDSDDDAPWKRLPSERSSRPRIEAPLPDAVAGVLAQRLFVEKAGLPSALLNEIKRLAAFQNPEFYKRQSMRLSTHLTPRVIACAEELPSHVALPRGCLGHLRSLLAEYSIDLAIDDQRTLGEELDARFHGDLTSVQQRAADALLKHDVGVFVAPPGIGKTVVGTFLIAERRRSTLVLVHRKPLLDQWVEQLSMFLDVEPKTIGQISGGKRKPNGQLDVAMVQSLVRGDEVDDLVARYGHVIVDECHHVPAVSVERVLREVKAKYIIGLTATPHRRDGHHPILEMQLGPIQFHIDAKSAAAKRPFEHQLIVRQTGFHLDEVDRGAGIQELYRMLSADERRNDLILNDIISALEARRSPIVLTERKDHLEFFESRLRAITPHLVVLQGGMTAPQRRKAADTLAAVRDTAERLVLATGRFIGEGFDDSRLDTLFLALPVSWKGTLAQYAGRLHRLRPGKTTVQIFDYVDHAVPMLARMFEKRLRTYRALGYLREEAEEMPPPTEIEIEYDDDAEAASGE
jgi:superfamily II DNA or RNA helicase